MHSSSHFRRAEGSRPRILGHRGARHAAPENTFAAFELARAEGADGVELDVRLSADGKVIVFHDPDLRRMTGGNSQARVEDVGTSELVRWDVGSGERIPLLDAVLDWARTTDSLLNVELKSDLRARRALVDAVAGHVAAEPRAAERIVLSSFDPRFVRALAARLPHVPTCWLVHDEQRLLRFAPGWRLLRAAGVHPQHTLLSFSLVRRLRASGALVGTWTVNDPLLAVGYARFGVDTIITDAPGRILALLEQTQPPQGE